MTPADRAKKGQTMILKVMAERTQSALATAMGVSETTINRLKADHLENMTLMLAHLGLKVVPSDFHCLNAAAYEFLTQTHNKIMQVAPELIWDIEE